MKKMKKNSCLIKIILLLASTSSFAQDLPFTQNSSVEDLVQHLIHKVQKKLEKMSYPANDSSRIHPEAEKGLTLRVKQILAEKEKDFDFENLQKFLIELLANNPRSWNSLYNNKKIKKSIKKIFKQYKKSQNQALYSEIKSILLENIDASHQDLDKMAVFFAEYLMEVQKASTEAEIARIDADFIQVFKTYFEQDEKNLFILIPKIKSLIGNKEMMKHLAQEESSIRNFRNHLLDHLLQKEPENPFLQINTQGYADQWIQKSKKLIEQSEQLGESLESLMENEFFSQELLQEISSIIPKASLYVTEKIKDFIVEIAGFLYTKDDQKNVEGIQNFAFGKSLAHMLEKMITVSRLKDSEKNHLLSIKTYLLKQAKDRADGNELVATSAFTDNIKQLLQTPGFWGRKNPSDTLLRTTVKMIDRITQILMQLKDNPQDVEQLQERSSLYLASKVMPELIEWFGFSEEEKRKLHIHEKSLINLFLMKNPETSVEILRENVEKIFQETGMFGWRKNLSQDFLQKVLKLLEDIDTIINAPLSSAWMPLLLGIPEEAIEWSNPKAVVPSQKQALNSVHPFYQNEPALLFPKGTQFQTELEHEFVSEEEEEENLDDKKNKGFQKSEPQNYLEDDSFNDEDESD
jgi:hypothetical protein